MAEVLKVLIKRVVAGVNMMKIPIISNHTEFKILNNNKYLNDS